MTGGRNRSRVVITAVVTLVALWGVFTWRGFDFSRHVLQEEKRAEIGLGHKPVASAAFAPSENRSAIPSPGDPPGPPEVVAATANGDLVAAPAATPLSATERWILAFLGDSTWREDDNSSGFSGVGVGLTYHTEGIPFATLRELVFKTFPNEGFRVSALLNDFIPFPERPSDGALSYTYSQQSLVAASAYATDPTVSPLLREQMRFRDPATGTPHDPEILKWIVQALVNRPGEFPAYIRDDHDCAALAGFPGPFQAAMEEATDAALRRNEDMVAAFDAHIAHCLYCQTHSECFILELRSRAREDQARHERSLASTFAVLEADPLTWMTTETFARIRETARDLRKANSTDLHVYELHDVLAAVRRAKDRRYASLVRHALARLREDFDVPEGPDRFDRGRFDTIDFLSDRVDSGLWHPKWNIEIRPSDSHPSYDIGRAADDLLWTLFVLDAPLTDWERKLLYHHRLIGDPKEHLRAAGFRLPGDPPPAPAAAKSDDE